MSHPDALARFEAEHDEALAALDRLEAAASAIEAGDTPTNHLETVSEVRSFLTSAVREHNENEEEALFPLLGGEGPAHQFVEEHHTLRSLERQLGASLDAGAVHDIPALAFSIVDLLRAHIQRENEMLFPMARELLGEEGLAEVARRLNDLGDR